MNIIFNEISIINKNQKIAKYQKFTEGINIVYSKNGDIGNYVGKSTLLKSLYHALGADAIFDNTKGWEADCKYYYILGFSIDDKKYNIVRHNRYFAIYNEGNNIIFSTNNREKLRDFYSNFFNMNIYLKDNKDPEHKYVLALPVALFCLTFIDQKRISGCKFDSFQSLSEYYDIYTDIIYSHLGINDSEFNKLQEEQNSLQNTINKLKIKISMAEEMISRINSDDDLNCFPDEIETLKNEIDLHKEKYKDLIEKLNKEKNELSTLYNEQVRIINFIKHLEQNKDLTYKNEKILLNHECPLCKNIIENYTEVFLKKINSQDQLVYQLNDANELLEKVDRNIEIHMEHYKNIYTELENIESLIYKANVNSDKILTSLGMKKYKKNLINEHYKYNEEMNIIDKKIEQIKNNIKQIQAKRLDIEEEYIDILEKMLVKYDIDVIELPKKMKIGTKLTSNDNHILSTLWLCALNRLKHSKNIEGTFFPFVMDNPTDRDLDDKNSKAILKMIFDMNDCCKQIIVSKVSFNEQLLDEYVINNRIHVLNEKYQLLNEKDYEKTILKLETLLLNKTEE